jgi:hypothetical protein
VRPSLSSREPTTIDLLTPLSVHVRPSGAHVHRTREPFQIFRVNDLIPTTTIARTLIDLSSLLPSRDLEIALNSAWRKVRTVASWLPHEIGKLHRTKNRQGIETLLAMVNRMHGRGLDSTLEVDALRILEKTDLPPPVRGLIIRDEQGDYVIRGDLGWEREKTVLHCDSVAFHSTERAMVRDAAQRSKLSLLNWTQIVVLKRMLNESTWVDQLRQALSRPQAPAK